MSVAHEKSAGFTLIEALAGLVVTAAILAGIATIAGQWLPHWRHGFQALQSADLVGLALDRVVEDVASAEYAQLDGGTGAPLFRAGASAVTFVRRAIGPGAAPRLEVVRIGETSTNQGLELQRAHASFAPGAIGAFRDATTLLRPPFRLTFAYAGPDGLWRDVWSDSPLLPRAIRLTIGGESPGAVASTVFTLKLTAAPNAAKQAQSDEASKSSGGAAAK